jgi:hypothetical protein
MWRRVGIILADVSEEHVACIFRVKRIGELGTALAANSKVNHIATLSETSVITTPTRRHIPEARILQ